MTAESQEKKISLGFKVFIFLSSSNDWMLHECLDRSHLLIHPTHPSPSPLSNTSNILQFIYLIGSFLFISIFLYINTVPQYSLTEHSNHFWTNSLSLVNIFRMIYKIFARHFYQLTTCETPVLVPLWFPSLLHISSWIVLHFIKCSL